MFLPIKHQHPDAALAETAARRIDLGHNAANRLHLILFQISNRPAIGEVLIIARKEEDEVGRSVKIELREQWRSLRPNAVYELDRRGENFGRSLLAVRGRRRCGSLRS